jgi:hypothetical protein
LVPSIVQAENSCQVRLDGDSLFLYRTPSFPSIFLPDTTFEWDTGLSFDNMEGKVALFMLNPAFYPYNVFVLNPVLDPNKKMVIFLRKIGGVQSIIERINPVGSLRFLEVVKF